MINIELKPAVNLTTKEALFISFPFDMEIVGKIKSLPKRYFIQQSKEWEVPVTQLDNLVQMFSDKKITLKAKKATARVQKMAEKVENKVSYLNQASEAFHYKTSPLDHQVEGFNYALKHNKFLLGDEQGLGKTKQAIDIAVNRKLTNNFKHCLIVCGVNGLKWNWLAEIKKHSDEKAHVLGTRIGVRSGKVQDKGNKEKLEDLSGGRSEYFIITNVETLRNKEIAEKLKEMTLNGTIGMTIIDEIHKCKNPSSSQGKAIHNLKSYFKMALTGTPLMNKAEDLYNPLKWLDAEQGNFHAFKSRYCIMGGYGGYQVVGYKNLNELQAKLDKSMLRRKKDMLNLPEKMRHTEYVEMTAKQAVLYKEVLAGIKANLHEIKLSPNPLAEIIRLRQVTAHTGILSKTINESAKVERLKEMLEELVESGQKAIVFSNWTSVTNRVFDELKEFNPALATGEVKNVQEQIDKFKTNDSCKVIIGTVPVLGTGFTLTEATHVFFLDKPWNMANTEQAEDRAHRIGTTSTVNVTTLVCKDTIDERIEEIIEEKANLAKGLVEGDEVMLAKYDSPTEFLERLLS